MRDAASQVSAKDIRPGEKRELDMRITSAFRVFIGSREAERTAKLTDRLVGAARGGDLDEMREIISQGGNINGYGKDGGTPPMEAIIYGGVDKAGFGRAMKFFKEMGADFGLQHRDNKFTVLHWMIFSDYSPIVLERAIKEYGLDVMIRDGKERAARQLAIELSQTFKDRESLYNAVAESLKQFERASSGAGR